MRFTRGPFSSQSRSPTTSSQTSAENFSSPSAAAAMKASSQPSSPIRSKFLEHLDPIDSQDSFSREECRDWLVLELGEIEQIPSLLKYDVGILEVKARLLSRYGGDHITQAMGVVDDLIQNKRNATGFGVDDGDLWAPWRHQHRRHYEDLVENLAEPEIPDFPNLNLIVPIPPRPGSKTPRAQFLPELNLQESRRSGVDPFPDFAQVDEPPVGPPHDAMDIISRVISDDLHRDVVLYSDDEAGRHIPGKAPEVPPQASKRLLKKISSPMKMTFRKRTMTPDGEKENRPPSSSDSEAVRATQSKT